MGVWTARKGKHRSPELLIGGERLKVFWLHETPPGSSSFILFPGGGEGIGGMAGFGERERAKQRKKDRKTAKSEKAGKPGEAGKDRKRESSAARLKE